jgi:CheY-like chemotaxis protein
MPEKQTLGGIRVLVVDDDEDTRDIVERVLSRRGADVITVPSAVAALETFGRERFDVLLVDIMMPGIDGYEFMRTIRALPGDKGGRVPAATLTARAGPDDRLDSLRAGFQSHLRKPVDPGELVEVVATLAGRTTST